MSIFSQTFLFLEEAQGQSSSSSLGMLKLYELFTQVSLPDAEKPFEQQLYYTGTYTVRKRLSGETLYSIDCNLEKWVRL